MAEKVSENEDDGILQVSDDEELENKEEELKKKMERLKLELELLEKEDKEIKRKKQQKEQKEQNKPPVKFRNLDIEQQKVEENAETVNIKHGPNERFSTEEKGILEIPYKKRHGTDSTHGIMYEVKISTLIFLKLFNLGYSFYLCSNLDGAGDIDDIVVKYTTKNNITETLFIQLKHAKDDNKTRTLSFVQKGSFFDLHKYFTSICNSQLFKDYKHVIFSSDPSNVKYLILTNSNVDKSILNNVNENEVSCFVQGISHQRDILRICEYKEYEEFCTLIEQANKHEGEQYDEQRNKIKSEKLRKILELNSNKCVSNNTSKEWDECKNISVSKFKNFISNTRIFCKQPNVNDVDIFIKDEIAKVTISSNETEQMFTRLINEMTKWQKNESYYLTENCRMWDSILREVSRSREREGELMNYDVRFKPEVVVEMQNTILEKKGVINIVCHDDITTVTALKVWQALNLNEQQDYILVSAKEYLEHEQSILRIWPNWWCKTLVIDSKEDCVLSDPVIEKLKSESKARLVIISPKKYNFQYCDLPSNKIIDNVTLDQLDNESQEKLITKIINFQGYSVLLSSILEKEHLQKLSSNALSHLITDDKFILGENFDSYKIEGYIKRHVEIPYVSKAILDNNDEDTILAIELKQEQSFLRGSLDIKMSTRDRLKTENPENVKKQTKCNYVILTKGKEEEEFKTLCDKFINVHWIKECNETNTQFVETERLYSENGKHGSESLLWKKSKGNIETVRRHLVSSEMYSVDEDMFIDIESPVIITGEPGIGKSSLIKQMAVSLKNHYRTKWVVFIELPKYCEFLDKIEVVQEQHIVDIIEESLNLDNVFSEYLINAVTNLKNFIILLDAFDEISPNYTQKVQQIVTLLVKYSFSVYITSRPSNVLDLGNHISAIPYTVSHLNKDEATIFLTNLLQKKNETGIEEKLKIFSSEVIAKPWSGQESFTTNPLHILMLAEIYNEKVKSENIIMFNILQIYTEFMKKKCEESYRKIKADLFHPLVKSNLQQFFQKFLSFNKIMAVKQIFSEELLKNFGIILEEPENATYFQIMKTGVAETINNNNIKYKHRSYAEYFSALWLAENCSKNTTILKEIFHKKEMESVRKFYDLKCAENCPLHTAVINFSEEELLNTLIQNRQSLTCVDILKRSALHLAAAYNNVQAVEILINHITDLYFCDIMHYTPTEYAITNCNWESVDILLSNHQVLLTKHERDQLALKSQHMRNEIIFTCCLTGLKNLIKTLNVYVNFNQKIQIPEYTSLNISKQNFIESTVHYSMQAGRKSFPLILAVHYNQYEVVKFLIENKCDPWVRNSDGNTVLHIASLYGYTKLVRYFLELGTCNKNNTKEFKNIECEIKVAANEKFSKHNIYNKDIQNSSVLSSTVCTNSKRRSKFMHKINSENIHEMTPLLLAAKKGHKDTFKCITDYDFDIKYITTSGKTALICACKGGNIDMVKLCIEKGCDINYVNKYGETALLSAARGGYLDVLKYCVENGCNINHANNDGNTALLLAAGKGHFDVLKYCVENSCNINHGNNDGNTALLLAAGKGHLEVVKYCVENGSNINHADNYGKTALLRAAQEGHLDVVKYCAENGSNINHADNYGKTALLQAAQEGHLDVVKYCVENGSNINHADNYGKTALLRAAQEGHLDVVKYCVENGSNINHADNYGKTALLRAAQEGHLDVVKYCVENGSNINHADNYGKTALLRAAQKGHLDVVKYCVENGSNINHADNSGETALHKAASWEKLEVVKYCVENGSNVNHVNNNGNTALHEAAYRGHLDIEKYFVENGSNINHADNDGYTALTALFATTGT